MSHPTPTYRAIQVVEPGHLELTELPVRQPEPGHVRIRVEACGVCHSDSVTVEGVMPVAFPRVPGHEVVGRIDAVGQGVSGWAVGQRVGVGFLAGPCGTCGPCRDGDFVNCTSQPLTGVHMDGGYAEMLIARASGLVSIPPELDSADAAPLLCAGLTTFDALRDGGAGPGDLVAVLGIGGLGHLAVQYARSMGFKVAVVARGAEKREVALDLGAHFYIDSLAQNASLELIGLGGARLILATAGDALAMSDVIAGLAPRGTMVVLGVAGQPLTVPTTALIFGERSITGSLTGTVAAAEDTLEYSVLQRIRPTIERFPLDDAANAYGRMMASQARFRNVLVM